jgi:hypothetical protein
VAIIVNVTFNHLKDHLLVFKDDHLDHLDLLDHLDHQDLLEDLP